MKDEELLIPPFDFSWDDFHRDLERALSAYIADGGQIDDPIIKLVEYSKSRTYPLWKKAQDMERNEPLEEGKL